GITGLPGVLVLTPQAALADMPVVTFRIARRPQTQVVDWLWRELRMRVQGVPDRRLDATRASFHFVNRTADVDWFIEAVRTLGACPRLALALYCSVAVDLSAQPCRASRYSLRAGVRMKPETRLDAAKLDTYIDSVRGDYENRLGLLVEVPTVSM